MAARKTLPKGVKVVVVVAVLLEVDRLFSVRRSSDRFSWTKRLPMEDVVVANAKRMNQTRKRERKKRAINFLNLEVTCGRASDLASTEWCCCSGLVVNMRLRMLLQYSRAAVAECY